MGTTICATRLLSWRPELGEEAPQARGPDILLDGRRSYLRGRRLAEQVAKRLGLGLVDAAAGEKPLFRPAGTLDRPLRERLRPGAVDLSRVPPRPEAPFIRYHGETERGLFELPARGLGLWNAFKLPLGMAAVTLPAYFLGLALPTILGANGIVALLWLATVFVPCCSPERIVASPEALRVERSYLGWRRTQVIPGEELEELAPGSRMTFVLRAVGTGDAVIRALSDRVLMELGAGLPGEDQRWLHAALLAHLGWPAAPYR